MIGPGFAAAALGPRIIAAAVMLILLGAGIALGLAFGVPWVLEHVAITVK